MAFLGDHSQFGLLALAHTSQRSAAQYGGLVSALGSDKAQVVPTDCWVTQI
jgi:hypothetical protein